MALRLFTVEEKISALHVELVEARRVDRPPGSAAQRHYDILKAIAADLRAREGASRIAAIDDLEAAIARVQKTRTAGVGYDEGQLIALAGTLMNKWPGIRQALEQFAQESAT
jgi:hypothetical protein